MPGEDKMADVVLSESKGTKAGRISPVARPSETLVISVREGEGLFKLCLLCTGSRVCPGCICMCKEEGWKDVYVCRKCDVPAEMIKSGQYILYPTPSEALEFYLRHRKQVQMRFAKRWIGVSMKVGGGEREEENKKREIIEKAFSTEEGESFIGKKSEIDFRELMVRGEAKQALIREECRLGEEFMAEASGRHSNMGLQARIRGCTQEEILRIVRSVCSNAFIFLAKHKYGTYVIQLILTLARDEELKSELKRKIYPHAVALLTHEIGNYVVQHVIKFDKGFVLRCFLLDLKSILGNKTGARAMKNCVKHFFLYRKELVPKIEEAKQTLRSQDSLNITRSILRDLGQGN
jgi:Pumilio-family RNA binding repeat